jgi:hypothetical protein
MNDFNLKEYTKEEYDHDMRQKLTEKGLYKAVKDILGDMIEENRYFGYIHFAMMSEFACDILKLIELSDGDVKSE